MSYHGQRRLASSATVMFPSEPSGSSDGGRSDLQCQPPFVLTEVSVHERAAVDRYGLTSYERGVTAGQEADNPSNVLG